MPFSLLGVERGRVLRPRADRARALAGRPRSSGRERAGAANRSSPPAHRTPRRVTVAARDPTGFKSDRARGGGRGASEERGLACHSARFAPSRSTTTISALSPIPLGSAGSSVAARRRVAPRGMMAVALALARSGPSRRAPPACALAATRRVARHAASASGGGSAVGRRARAPRFAGGGAAAFPPRRARVGARVGPLRPGRAHPRRARALAPGPGPRAHPPRARGRPPLARGPARTRERSLDARVLRAPMPRPRGSRRATRRRADDGRREAPSDPIQSPDAVRPREVLRRRRRAREPQVRVRRARQARAGRRRVRPFGPRFIFFGGGRLRRVIVPRAAASDSVQRLALR